MANIDLIPHNFLLCRDLQHAWTPQSATVQKNSRSRRQEIHRTMTCARCATQRIQRLSSDGRIVGARYLYPEHYVLKGSGGLSVSDRAAVRLRGLGEWQ